MEESRKILVVDDEESLRGLLLEVLRDEGYDVKEACSGEQAIELIKGSHFSLVITDIRMEGMNGIDLLRKVKEIDRETQVVLMTSYSSKETAISAVRLGAYDYLVKPFEDLDQIAEVAKRALAQVGHDKANQATLEGLVRRNEELEEVNQAIRDLAIRDGLTGLFNHRHFQETIGRELDRAVRYKRKLSIIFLDVDHFKQYNDSMGHLEGDKVLKEIARTIEGRMRSTDLAARYGGEEFVILLPETSRDDAWKLAEQLREKIAATPFSGSEKQPLGRVTISSGVSSFPEDGADAMTLVHHADEALYRAKQAGRNRTC